LDEIGRGTSTFDGLSLAWSIVEYIHNNRQISAKTLFATHYHELTELENILPGVKNYNISVKEWNDKIIFLRKIERGSADQSYGVQVARLAGIPQTVIKRAKEILKNLEEHELSPQGLSAQTKRKLLSESNQMDIFDAILEKDEAKNQLLEEIKKIDVNNLTPLEAIQKLADLKSKL
jgi:DNA mismatch repair protein MutS